ncbi:hypothetical protein ASPNIDRAFT_39336 [Aspergillus niger ATCC 1015]|uniref:DNA2/NAM7 helicase-like C-terminal domain-containing protein n=1 Tax=Aspergillus niger (strain ATCC 1015 / CBS 113.46 / FGSC A1144 / LSHB Ac4 / NCTC 3858a / NRRL 328 / USDA 3528.7) TaxID=380704 RepID=G3YB49_ASPNA|nr:hypothetical protein ASPNIDRAFT_39336 [Aspergillus niger ATCC 1015]
MSTLFSATGKVTQAVGVRFSIVTSAVANTMSIDAQIEALGEAKDFLASLEDVVCSVSLIQGPRGTGKASTAKAIVYTAAALGCKIFLVARSKQDDETLAKAVMKALQWDERLQRWCGQLERTRGGEPSDKGDNLSHVQAHVFTIQYAQKHVTTDKYAQSLLERSTQRQNFPYAAQRASVGRLMGEHEVSFRENLTVDVFQDQESPMIIFMLTKPSKNPVSVSFIADQQWFNVALSCAREILVIVGNRIVWESATIDKITKTIGKKTSHVEEEKPVGPEEYKRPDRTIRQLFLRRPPRPSSRPQRPAQASGASSLELPEGSMLDLFLNSKDYPRLIAQQHTASGLAPLRAPSTTDCIHRFLKADIMSPQVDTLRALEPVCGCWLGHGELDRRGGDVKRRREDEAAVSDCSSQWLRKGTMYIDHIGNME